MLKILKKEKFTEFHLRHKWRIISGGYTARNSTVLSGEMGKKVITLNGINNDPRCIFACGADIKNRFSFTRNGRIYLSGDNGDLADADNFSRYMDSVRKIKAELDMSPEIIAHDLHPLYFSSRAESIFNSARRIGVQHHHAHIASVLARSGTEEPVIGVSFDGTGYGLDGNIWGGEFLVVSQRKWHRCGHLKYIKMPGGEKAVREPWRMAFTLLYDCRGEKIFEKNLPFLKFRQKGDYLFLKAMIDGNINAPLTSSCGRLFDAVSSLLGITHVVNFEAEAAVKLENMASSVFDSRGYEFDIVKTDGEYIVGCEPLLDAMISELEKGVPVECIARRFHNSLAMLILEMAGSIGRDRNLKTVVLSGGVFQNKLLYELSSKLLRENGFELLESGNVPMNDLGICVGQTYVVINETQMTKE